VKRLKNLILIGVASAVALVTPMIFSPASPAQAAASSSSTTGSFQFCAQQIHNNVLSTPYNVYYKISGTLYNNGGNFAQRTTSHTDVFNGGEVCVNQNDAGLSSLQGGHYTIEMWGVNPITHVGVKMGTINWASTKCGGQSRHTVYNTTGSVPAPESFEAPFSFDDTPVC